jgi:putative transposase
MNNQHHLLLETPTAISRLYPAAEQGLYTGRTGHLFQGRYKAILIQQDSRLLEVCPSERVCESAGNSQIMTEIL